MRLLLGTLLLSAAAVSSSAGDFDADWIGTSAASFLSVPVGARAVGLGEAYSAVADDAGALFWNPAALTRLERGSAFLTHASYFGASELGAASYARPAGTSGLAFGLGVQSFSAGAIPETDASGVELGTYRPGSVAALAGLGWRLKSGHAFGLTAKYVETKVADTARTAAFDAGFLSRPYLGGKLRLAATAVNLGARIRFGREDEPLPAAVRLGAACQGERWLTAADAVFPSDNRLFLAVGAEARLPLSGGWALAARAGFNTRTLGDFDQLTGFSAGGGLSSGRFGFDYAFMPMGALGAAHRVSLTLR